MVRTVEIKQHIIKWNLVVIMFVEPKITLEVLARVANFTGDPEFACSCLRPVVNPLYYLACVFMFKHIIE